MSGAWIAFAGSVLAAVLSGVFAIHANTRSKLFDRKLRAEETLAKYREPMAAAAFDLQSRLYNSLRRGF